MLRLDKIFAPKIKRLPAAAAAPLTLAWYSSYVAYRYQFMLFQNPPAQHCSIPGQSPSGRRISLRLGHCYITFHAYSVYICIGINLQRISFNYPGKMAERFYSMIPVFPQWLKIGYLYLFTQTSNKYDCDICSLDIAQKHLRRVPKTLPSDKNTLKMRN